MENVYCRDVDLNFVISTDAIDIAKSQMVNDAVNGHFFNESIDSTLEAFLDDLGIKILHAEIFYTPPGSVLKIHIDGGHEYINRVCKLNWVVGAKGSYMCWFDTKDPVNSGLEQATKVETNYVLYSDEDSTEIWRQEVNFPSLVNAGIPHSVMNPTTEPRWCMSFALGDKETGESLFWEEAVLKLEKYITS
jgi:hypothetical protein